MGTDENLIDKMRLAFCVGWERGNSIYGSHDPDEEFEEWMNEKKTELVISGWQPIDSAPKDGTKVDLWVRIRPSKMDEPESHKRFTDAWWDEGRNDWKLGRLCWHSKFYADAHIPELWMPSVKGPEAAQ